MADVQEVLIYFKVDYSELTTAQEQLSKGGKIDASQFKAIQSAISTTATDTQGLIKDFKTVATTATKMGKSVENAFGAGIQDALDEAGVSVKEFSDALTKANAPTKTLKKELLELKEALARMKAEGKDTGAEFEALRARAGKLSDAVADAGAEIKNAGSDTRGLDNVVGTVSALAGGFAAVQGAAALFGDENEDVQKALLKVNGAMALAQGLQIVYNATLKEGAITKLADSIATGAQSAAMTLYTFVTGGATVATRVFRAALISTGIGALVVLVIALVQAMSSYGEKTETAADQQQRLADATANLNQALSDQIDFLNEVSDLNILRAKAEGKTEKEITDLQRKAITDRIALRQKEIDSAIAGGLSIAEITLQQNKDINDLQKFDLEQRIANNEKAKKLAKENADKARAEKLAELKDTLALLELNLSAAQKGSAIELDLKKKIVHQKSLIEIAEEKAKDNKLLQIRGEALLAQQELQKNFNEKATQEQLQAQLDINNAALSGIIEGYDKRLELQIANLEIQSQLEINANKDNAAKILLIEAKKLSDIRALRNAAIEKEANDFVNDKGRQRFKEAMVTLSNDVKQNAEVRKAAAKSAGDAELIEVDRLISANEQKQQSLEDYNKTYSDLALQRADIEENTAKKIKSIDEQAKKDRIDALIAIGQETINIASQVGEFFSNLSALATEQERQRIDEQKQQLQSLIDAGAITAKQAKIRAQEIEIQERRARQRAAQREKQAAVFKAVLAIPQAFLTGLTQSLPLAFVYAALAAAEAAIIIARPVPKFFRGKRDNYQGPGEIADMGSEIVERNGRMFLYTKPTQTYLGARDKVYTASQTRQILHNTNVNTTVMPAKQERFDYDRFASSIPKSSVAINIEKDFISEAVSNGLSKNNYFNSRYKFNR